VALGCSAINSPRRRSGGPGRVRGELALRNVEGKARDKAAGVKREARRAGWVFGAMKFPKRRVPYATLLTRH
jgi:hypothetical protein